MAASSAAVSGSSSSSKSLSVCSATMDELVEPIVEPIKNALVVIDKKIRNLEKKKSKLDNLREEVRKSGKPLNEDQTQSLARYDDNNQQLDTFRELQKQFTSCSEDIRKCYRKILRKEQQAEQERLGDLERYRLVVGALEAPDVLMDVIQETEGLPENCREQLEQLRRLLFPLRWDQLPVSARGKWPPSEEHLQFVSEQQCNLLYGRPLQAAPGARELPDCKELLDTLLTSPYFVSHPEALLHSHKSLPGASSHHEPPHPATTSSATLLKKEPHLKANAAPTPHTHSFKSTASGVVAGEEANPVVTSVVVPVVLPPDYQHGSSMSFVNSKITSGIVPPGPIQQQQHHMPVNSTGIPHAGMGVSSVALGSTVMAPPLPVSSGLPSLAVDGPPVASSVMPLTAGAVPVSFPVASSAMGAFHAHGHGPNLIPSTRSHAVSAVDRERSSSFGALMLDPKEDVPHVGAIGTHRGISARAPIGDNAVAQGQSAWQNSRIGTFDPKNPEGDATDLSLAGPDAFHSHSPANDNQENRGFGDDMYKRREHEGNGYGFRGGAVPGGMNRGGRGGVEPPQMGRTDRRSFDDSSERGRMGFPVDDRQRQRFPNERNMERAGVGPGPRGVPPPMGRYPGGAGDNRGPYRNSNEFEHNGNGDMMVAQNSMLMAGKELGEKNPASAGANASESHTDYGLFHVPNPNYKGRTGLEPDRRYDRNRERERNEQRERDERNRGGRRTGNIYM